MIWSTFVSFLFFSVFDARCLISVSKKIETFASPSVVGVGVHPILDVSLLSMLA